MTRRLAIARTWDGAPAPAGEHAFVEVTRTTEGLAIAVDAPWHGDPPPSAPPGPTPALWEHEVVELFVAGVDQRYLELEIGPHGHHLVLWLEGVRRPIRERLPLSLEVRRDGPRWRARAETGPQVPLPDPPWRLNAYSIHGAGAARRHLAFAPVPGAAPDFHRLDAFVAWDALPLTRAAG